MEKKTTPEEHRNFLVVLAMFGMRVKLEALFSHEVKL
jgi:hypothetical protein